MTDTQEMYASWLADPRNASHPDRGLLQLKHDQLSGRATTPSSGAQLTEAELANQVLASAGITPTKVLAEPRTEGELAAQIVAIAGIKTRP